MNCNPGDWYVVGAGVNGATISSVKAGYGPGTGVDPSRPFGDIRLGLGWDFGGGEVFDLDASVVALDASNTVVDVIFFNHKVGCNGSIVHSGDNRTGQGEGDDEVITLSLQKVPANVVRLVCVVNSYTRTSLSRAKSAYVRVLDGTRVLAIHTLTRMVDSVGMIFCFFQRDSKGSWMFQSCTHPVSGNTANESLRDITDFVARIPMF